MNSESAPPPAESLRPRRIYRSGQNKLIGGVCGGFAEYFNLDVTLMRVIWLLITIFGGVGLMLYLVCWIIIPLNPAQVTTPQHRNSGGIIIGIALVVIGFILLMSWLTLQGCWMPLGMHMWALPGSVMILGIAIVLILLLTKPQHTPNPPTDVYTPPAENKGTPSMNRLYRSRDQRILSGICGGFGKYFNLDPTIVRILWVVLGIGSFGTALILYVILIFVIPEEPIV